MSHLYNTTALSLLTPPFPVSLKIILAAFNATSEIMLSFDRVLEQILDRGVDGEVTGFSNIATSILNTGVWQ